MSWADERAKRRAKACAEPHVVYWLIDAEDRVLYIGCTRRLTGRLEDHSKSKDWWGRVARVEVDDYPDWATAHSAEGQAIYTERPIFNKKVLIPKVPMPPIIRRGEPLHAVESEAV